MPSQSMASQNLAVLLGKVRNDVGLFVGKLSLCRLRRVPLLTVLGDELTELFGVVGEGLVSLVAKVSVVDGGAKVLESGGLRQAVELGRDGARGQETKEGGLVHGLYLFNERVN